MDIINIENHHHHHQYHNVAIIILDPFCKNKKKLKRQTTTTTFNLAVTYLVSSRVYSSSFVCVSNYSCFKLRLIFGRCKVIIESFNQLLVNRMIYWNKILFFSTSTQANKIDKKTKRAKKTVKKLERSISIIIIIIEWQYYYYFLPFSFNLFFQ